MTEHTVAGHRFRSLTPGEYCIGENCTGIRSLVELTRLADVATEGDKEIAHVGALNAREVGEIREARVALDKAMERVFQ